LVAILTGGALGVGGVATNAFGLGALYERAISKIERILAGPPPDRPTLPTLTVTPKPASPSPEPTASQRPVASGQPTPQPTPRPTPVPRVGIDVDIVAKHGPEFAHELRD